MKILLLGIGLQGRAALYDLIHSQEVHKIIACDLDLDQIGQFTNDLTHPKVQAIEIDVVNTEQVSRLMEEVDAVIYLLPTRFRGSMAKLAISAGVHFVDASYSNPEYLTLNEHAREKGVSILPEFGLDPGIDLVLSARAIREFDEVDLVNSYGAGFPEPSAANNPLQYKISWSFSGVLAAYDRTAKLVRNGKVVRIPRTQIFAEKNIHMVDIDGLGSLEAYPNGDASKYLTMLGLEGKGINAGRYSMRWPGHSAIWNKLKALGFLNQKPLTIDGASISPRKFIHDLLQPQLLYQADERDIAIIRVEVAGRKDGLRKKVMYQMVDYRDLESGLLAMQRTVGFTASIGAQMILRGDISKRGVLSPLLDVPPDILISELKARGIFFQRWEETAL